MEIIKVVQVNGVNINSAIDFTIEYMGFPRKFICMPYNEYISYNFGLLNPEDIHRSDMVVVYESLANNSQEIYYCKIILSILYFSNRISIEKERKYKFIEDMKRAYMPFFSEASKELNWLENTENKYQMEANPFIRNLSLDGFWSVDDIIRDSWCIKLGEREMSSDDFERYLTRGYGGDLLDSYDKRYIFNPYIAYINVKESVKEEARRINRLICSESYIGHKLKSIMRLYYEVFQIHCNTNMTIITLSTILETLLLGKDEDNQRKKVSVRAACIIFNGLDAKWKTYIADIVYFFYSYRNGIVHDGKNYLEYPEVTLDISIQYIKHIIYCIIEKMVDGSISSNEDIIKIVEKNQNMDGLDNAFHYISPNAGKTFVVLPPE